MIFIHQSKNPKTTQPALMLIHSASSEVRSSGWDLGRSLRVFMKCWHAGVEDNQPAAPGSRVNVCVCVVWFCPALPSYLKEQTKLASCVSPVSNHSCSTAGVFKAASPSLGWDGPCSKHLAVSLCHFAWKVSCLDHRFGWGTWFCLVD